MPHLNHTGPEGKGSKTGRGLGKCSKNGEADLEKMGKGKGLKRKSEGGTGRGGRLKSSKIFDNQNTKKNENCNSDEE